MRMTQAEQSGSRSISRWARTAVRATLSGAALIWVLHTTPLRSIASALSGADLALLLAGLLLNFCARLAAAERTLAVSRGLGLWLSRWQTIETLFISNFYALLSPGPILSGVVTVYRYRGFGASITGSLGSLLASRVVECVVFVAIGMLCVLVDSHVSFIAIRYPLVLAGLGLCTVALALGIWWRMHRRWKNRVVPHAAVPIGTGMFAGLRAVRFEVMQRGPGMVLRAAVPAAAQVLLSGLATAVLAKSLGIALPALTAMWVTAAVYAVVLLPISVAGVGVREITLVRSLALLGIDSSLAVALSVLLFADPVINALIGGALQLRAAFGGVSRQT
jgi:glycosyltransferase 2 family protein